MGKQRLGQAFVSAGATTRGHSRSAADCIGRVGGLAAALGVGAMLFVAPWTAAAETEGASSSESSATSEPDSTESTDSSDEGAGAGDSDTSGSSDDDSDDDTETDAEADELDAELSDEIADELDEDPDDEGAASSGDDDADDDAEAVAAEEAVDIADTFVDEVVDEMDDVVVGSGGSNVVVETDTAAPEVVADEPEAVIEDEPSEDPQGVSSLDAGITSTEPASSRSSYTSASVMAARTSIEEITEPPAKALQAQPGTFLEVASSMLSAVIAPFVTTPAAPAAPSAQPLMWGVLSWVRRELDDTFANFSISIGGRQIVQNGTAYATSQGFGSFAIAYGENSIASASGLFNVAIVRGDDSTATSEGNFTRVRVRGDDNTAGADGPGSRATVYGNDNTAETTGAYTSIYVRGVGNEATSSGSGNSATVYGDGNEVVLASQDGSARARVVGDRNTATSVSEDGRTRVSVVGDDNDATALATNGSRAEITVRGDENSAAASADEDSTARVSIIGDGSTAVADADADGYAAARITGDSNVASSEAVDNTSIAKIVGDGNAASGNAMLARAEASIVGDGNAAEANDGKAVISGDSSSATADGPGSLARVWGDTSVASALGEDNTAFVWGNESRALAGPGTGNNALAFGNNLLADTGPGDGRTVYGQPFDPENQAPVAGAPGAQTVDPETGTVTGTLGFTDPDGDDLTYTVTTPPIGGTLTVAADGSFVYTPTAAARLQADAGTTTSFTVSASDGQASASTTIGVPITPAEADVDDVFDIGDFLTNIAVTADGSTVWVSKGGVTLGESVVVIDADSGAVIGEITVGENPDGIAFSPDGSTAYVAVPSEGTLAVIDTATRTLTTTIEVGTNPREVAISADGTRAYVSDGIQQGSVSVVDLESNTVIDEIEVDPNPDGLALSLDGTRLYAVTNLGTVSVIDLVPGTAQNPIPTFHTVIDTITVGQSPDIIAIHPSGTFAYVTNSNPVSTEPGSISVVDLDTNTEIAVISVGIAPADVAFSPDGSIAYVPNIGNSQTGTVSIIDSATHTVIDTVDVGFGPNSIAVGPDGTVYVTNAFDGTVSVISAAGAPSIPAAPPVLLQTGELDYSAVGAQVVGPDGAQYLVGFTGGLFAPTASVHVLNPDGSSTPVAVADTTGFSTGQLVFAADRFAYLTTVDPGTTNVYDSDSTQLLVIDLDNPGTFTEVEIAGTARYGAVIGPDGMVYQLTQRSALGGQPRVMRVAIIDPFDPQAATVLEFENTGAGTPLVPGPQAGTFYFASSGVTDTGASKVDLFKLDVNAAGDALTLVATNPGPPTNTDEVLVVGPDGAIYLRTRGSSSPPLITVIDPQNPDVPVQIEPDGQNRIVLGLDGIAYTESFTRTRLDPSDDRTTVDTIHVPPSRRT